MTTTELTQGMIDNLNLSQQIKAWCSAVTNSTVAQAPGDWYAPFMANLATAQSHSATYLTTIGPNAFSLLPNAIINYGSTHNNALGDVQSMLDSLPPGQSLTDAQVATVVEIFDALQQTLNALMGTTVDSNITVPPPVNPTLYGSKNDLNTFLTWITQDNKNLVSGQNGAATEVGLLEVDEQTMQNAISNLHGEIAIYNKDVEVSEVGIGVSIFVAIVGLALAPLTGGASLVATGVGIAGVGGSIASTVVYTEKIKADFAKIADDQAKYTTDQQQVSALNGIIAAMSSLETANTTAQTALGSVLDTFAALIEETATTLTALQQAESAQAAGILETLNIQNAISDWTNLIKTAQDILSFSNTTHELTPPAGS